MYYWYKIAFFDETPEDEYEAETVSVGLHNFFRFLKLTLCVVLNHN
jgi:hypothetical protein